MENKNVEDRLFAELPDLDDQVSLSNDGSSELSEAGWFDQAVRNQQPRGEAGMWALENPAGCKLQGWIQGGMDGLYAFARFPSVCTDCEKVLLGGSNSGTTSCSGLLYANGLERGRSPLEAAPLMCRMRPPHERHFSLEELVALAEEEEWTVRAPGKGQVEYLNCLRNYLNQQFLRLVEQGKVVQCFSERGKAVWACFCTGLLSRSGEELVYAVLRRPDDPKAGRWQHFKFVAYQELKESRQAWNEFEQIVNPPSKATFIEEHLDLLYAPSTSGELGKQDPQALGGLDEVAMCFPAALLVQGSTACKQAVSMAIQRAEMALQNNPFVAVPQYSRPSLQQPGCIQLLLPLRLEAESKDTQLALVLTVTKSRRGHRGYQPSRVITLNEAYCGARVLCPVHQPWLKHPSLIVRNAASLLTPALLKSSLSRKALEPSDSFPSEPSDFSFPATTAGLTAPSSVPLSNGHRSPSPHANGTRSPSSFFSNQASVSSALAALDLNDWSVPTKSSSSRSVSPLLSPKGPGGLNGSYTDSTSRPYSSTQEAQRRQIEEFYRQESIAKATRAAAGYGGGSGQAGHQVAKLERGGLEEGGSLRARFVQDKLAPLNIAEADPDMVVEVLQLSPLSGAQHRGFDSAGSSGAYSGHALDGYRPLSVPSNVPASQWSRSYGLSSSLDDSRFPDEDVYVGFTPEDDICPKINISQLPPKFVMAFLSGESNRHQGEQRAEQYCEQTFGRYGLVAKSLVRENKNHVGKWFAIVEFVYWTDEEVRTRLVAGEQIRFPNFFDGEDVYIRRHKDKLSKVFRSPLGNPTTGLQCRPGWKYTGTDTRAGKPLYKGPCTVCGRESTVPFKPVINGQPPRCRNCLPMAQGGLQGQGSGLPLGLELGASSQSYGNGSLLPSSVVSALGGNGGMSSSSLMDLAFLKGLHAQYE